MQKTIIKELYNKLSLIQKCGALTEVALKTCIHRKDEPVRHITNRT
jgi:hypothetical protein